ncbi:MAG: efflux RND transporter periplasmic adaptor subunit [Polyangiales bacterium]
MNTRTKQVLMAVAGLLAVLLVLGGIKGAQIAAMIKAGESFQPPPEAVTTAAVETARWGSSIVAIGSIQPVMGVMLTAEIPGTVREIRFESGQEVKEGDLLLRMDTSTERAELAAAQADATLAEAELGRTRSLLARDARSQADLDIAIAKAARARAAVRNVSSVISKKTIRAPFSGRLGIRKVDVGEFLQPGTQIVALDASHPAYVDFRVPQQALAEIEAGQEVTITGDTFGDRAWMGKVDSIDARIDPSTRNVLIRALVDNPDGRLRPGMFVDVKVTLPNLQDVLLIPETALLYAPYGDSVFLVRGAENDADGQGDLTVEQLFVRVGERRGDLRAIDSGLEPGQTIVSTGAFKLQNGSAIVVNNALAPKVSENPTPEDR